MGLVAEGECLDMSENIKAKADELRQEWLDTIDPIDTSKISDEEMVDIENRVKLLVGLPEKVDWESLMDKQTTTYWEEMEKELIKSGGYYISDETD